MSKPGSTFLRGVVAVVCSLGLWGSAWAQTPRTTDYIVALVNQRPITHQEFQHFKRLLVFFGQANDTTSDSQEILNAMIETQLMVMEAEKSGFKITDAELQREVASLAKANQISVEQLSGRAQAAGIPWDVFEQHLRDQLFLQKLRVDRVTRGVRLSPSEVQRALDQALSKLQTRTLRLSQILIPVPEGADAATVQDRKSRAERARQAVLSGRAFEAVVREFSAGSDAATGGDLGERTLERWPELFVQAVNGLPVGGVSMPVRSGAGWHILRLVSDVTQTSMPTYPQTLVRHILLRASQPQEYAKARQQLLQIRQQIVRGEMGFEAAAQRYSEDGSASSGGALGWTSPGALVPDFENAMNGLNQGQLSEPVETEFGVHLIEVMQRRNMEMTNEQVRLQVENQLRQQKAPKALEEWLLNLRGRSFIELREPPQ